MAIVALTAASSSCRPAQVLTPAGVTVCQGYDPTALNVVAPEHSLASPQPWTVRSGGVVLERAATKEDAEHVLGLASNYRTECRIGSSQAPATYWRDPLRPLRLEFTEDCVPYNPDAIQYRRDERGASGVLYATEPGGTRRWMVQAANQAEIDAVLAVARAAHAACVIGNWEFDPDRSARNAEPRTVSGHLDLDAERRAWHPVYYWK